MKVQEVIDRVTKDPEYASELIKKVSRLTSTGSLPNPDVEDTWQEVLKEFAESPEELARLSSVNSPMAGSTTWTVTVTSVTTTTFTPTSPVTVTTMTTMTTATLPQ